MKVKKGRKTKLGQHFLRSKGALRRIIEAARVAPDEVVLEIGPGMGVLTEELLRNARRVIAVEKDRDLIAVLEKKFANEISENRLVLVSADIRDVAPHELGLEAGKYKLVANIPYYITGEILRTFLSHHIFPNRVTLLVQDEVAKRTAKEKKESILSISVKVFGTPRYVAKVPAGSFAPAPQVDSAILNIEDVSRNNFADVDEEFFFSLVRAGFGSKRKQLIGNLKQFAPREEMTALFEQVGLPEKVRAEEVKLPQWLALARALKN